VSVKSFGFWGFFILLFIVITQACGSSSDEKSKSSTIPTDIKNFTEVKCSMCHSLERIYKDKRSPLQWTQLVARMRLLNPNWLSEEDVKHITEYLIENNSKTG
jgi:hypothetical protein